MRVESLHPVPDSPPQDVTVSSSSSSSITIVWQHPNSGEQVQNYEVKYGTNPDQMTSTATVSGSTLTYQAQNLQPGTWYYFSVGTDSSAFSSALQGATACECFFLFSS